MSTETAPRQGILSDAKQAEREELIELLTQGLLDGDRDGDELHRELDQPGRRPRPGDHRVLQEDIQEELGHAQQFGDRIKELYGVVPGSLGLHAPSSPTSSRPTSRPTSST